MTITIRHDQATEQQRKTSELRKPRRRKRLENGQKRLLSPGQPLPTNQLADATIDVIQSLERDVAIEIETTGAAMMIEIAVSGSQESDALARPHDQENQALTDLTTMKIQNDATEIATETDAGAMW